MTSLSADPALANPCTLSSGLSPAVDRTSWLGDYITQAAAPAQTGEIDDRLKHIGFDAIVAAIETACPSLPGTVVVRIYQDWIAANAEAGRSLFAAWFNLGVALARQNEHARAATAYASALELKPDFCAAAVNLGLSLEAIGHTDAALRTWESATQTNDARTTLLNQKGRLLEAQGRLGEAEIVLRTSLLTHPTQPDAAQHWLHIRQKMCQWPVLTADMPGLSSAELLHQSGPLGLLALTDDIGIQCAVTAAWIARKMPPAPMRLSPPAGYRHDPIRHDRIRVGYLSSDFCRHAMSFLIAELFERHDRTRFEIYGYCSTLEDGSDIRQRVIAAFDHHRPVRHLSDEQAARMIRNDEIDILIDLNGLTAHTRLAVMRWRPAPVQATYLGFIGPVPLPELDYLLCDDFVIPPDQADTYRPTPLPIAHSYQANDSKRAVGPPLSRQDAGLPDDGFVFCCFSNHYKITEAMFAAWMSILRNVDGSVLWLTTDNAASQANLRASAAGHGIAPERILFADRTSPETYMRRLALADLFLDTFPYNAGTVASDALRMQLPLLTLSGAAFASRMAGSLLHAMGAEQGIAASLPEYVATATRLATDTAAYANYRQHFSGDAWKQTAGNIVRFTADFEAALIRAIRTPANVPAHDVVASGDCSLTELIAAAETLLADGKTDRALHLYDAWLRQHPTDPLRHLVCFNHGSLLLQSGDLTRARVALAEAIELKPAFLLAYINSGLALERLGHLDLAARQWLQAVDLPAPVDDINIGNKTTALKHLARLYKSNGDVRSAEEALRRCLLIDPRQRDVIQHWIAVRQMQCKWPVIAPSGTLTQSTAKAALSPLALAIHTDDPMYQLANAWRSFELDVVRSPVPHTVGRWIPPATPAHRPLRIGYASPDLREHAVGFLTAELFELHDPAKVEVFAYYSGRAGPDAMQARIRRAVPHWRNIVGWRDKQAARQIVHDEIDILVDLGGHTGDAATAAAALRPAPVIVNWLGYPGSMGTPHHQYIIADATIIPPAYEKYYSERVMRLPCYQPTDRKRIVGPPLSRRDAGLDDAAMVYCCFNGTQKITPGLFACWMAILRNVDGAVLWLLSCDTATDERLRQQAVQHGVAPDRLVFAARKLNAEHLARYQLADLFLDTFPYGAHTTASDSLWMGVPVLTIAGHGFAARVCASLVRSAGLDELVCGDLETYQDKAIRLGTRPAMLSALRHRLRDGRDQCTLFDMPLLVTRLESLYEQMWDEYLSGRIPEPDLTNFGIHHEIGCESEHETAQVSDLAAYEQRQMTALAYRNGISPIPADRRFWAGSH